jgi:[acyl-carrier-protein] S-malonyltransferase
MKNKRFVFLFPGQGAQFVGMMKDFYDTFAESRQVFEEAEDVLKMSLKPIIFNGPKELLTQTVNCQKAIFISSYAILKAFELRLPECIPQATCGLSLGEYTALAASGKARFSDLLPIVDKRATFMQKACEKTPSSMSVVLGQEGPWVQEVLRSTGLPVWVANLNCPGQVVIAGEIEPLAKAAVALKEAGAKRVLPLEVSGAFHTPLMESAKQALSPYLEDLKLQPSSTALVMNATGQLVKEAEEIRQLLIEQVTSPVYWAKGIQQLAPTTDIFIEMGPGNTLAGMNKRIGVEAPTYSIQTTSDLTTVLNTIEESYAT